MSRDSGSTTFEALAAILLLSVAGAAALGAASGGMRAYKAGGAAAAAAARALAVDDALRSAVREIRVPWWERQARVEIERTADGPIALRAAYWNGLGDKALEISGADGGLRVATPEGARVFEGVELTGAAAAPAGDGPPRGVRVDYEIRGRSFSTAAEFGAWAFGEASP